MAPHSPEKIKSFHLEPVLFLSQERIFLFTIATAKVSFQDLESNLNHYQLAAQPLIQMFLKVLR